MEGHDRWWRGLDCERSIYGWLEHIVESDDKAKRCFQTRVER